MDPAVVFYSFRTALETWHEENLINEETYNDDIAILIVLHFYACKDDFLFSSIKNCSLGWDIAHKILEDQIIGRLAIEDCFHYHIIWGMQSLKTAFFSKILRGIRHPHRSIYLIPI